MEIVQKSARFHKGPLRERLALKATFIFLSLFAGKLRNWVLQPIRFCNQFSHHLSDTYKKMIKTDCNLYYNNGGQIFLVGCLNVL